MSQSKNVNALRRRERKDIKRLEKQVGGGTVVQSSGGGGAYVHPNHSGDVTSVGDGAQTIPNDTVTYAKMQNVSAASKLLGRGDAAGSGDVEEITLGTGLTMTATTLAVSSSTQSQIMKLISFRA